MKEKAVPSIRFSGFTERWQSRRLSELTKPVGRRNKNGLELETYAVTNDRGFIPQNEAHDVYGYMQNVDQSMYNIVPPNSFAYNPARINVGSIGYYSGKTDVLVSSLYEVFSTSDDIDDGFLAQWIQTRIFQDWIRKLQEGSVRLYFYYDKLCEVLLNYPQIEEQQKIADFLSSVDDVISTSEEEVANLEKQKKAVMKKIFSQEVRFKRGDGTEFPEWEEKTLGEVCEPLQYGMNAAAGKYDGRNKYIRITDIDDSTHAYLEDNVVSPTGELSDKYLVCKGDILLARTGASTGKSYLYKENDGRMYFAGFLIRAHVKDGYDDYFVYSQTLTYAYEKWVKLTSQRSGQPGINAEEYSGYILQIPCLEEQRFIANFLFSFDEAIAAAKKELELWKELKKGLLQQMFV